VQFDALWSSTSKPSNNNEASTSQVKLEVKRLEQMVSELVKQAKVRPSQDNRRSMVSKLKRVQTSLSELLNKQTKLNLSRGNRMVLKMRRLSMQ
jgi:hypothetical protein